MTDLPPPPPPSPDPASGPEIGPDTGPGAGGDPAASNGAAAPTDPAEPGTENRVEHSLGEIVAIARDIALYAPISLVLDAPTVLPKLAAQGKQHMRNAKALGPHALRRIQNRLLATAETVGEQAGELLRQFGVVPGPDGDGVGDGDDRGGRGRRDGATSRRPSPVVERRDGPASSRPAGAGGDGAGENGRAPVAPSPAADELAIPDYDSLSALQVVDRLPGLTPDELEAVRTYEAAHRGRKTILNKAAQLQT